MHDQGKAARERERRPEPSPEDIAATITKRATAELERWLSEPLAQGLYLVATPIGNLGDMTLRAIAVLARADLICCEDTRHSRPLLAHFGIDRPLSPYHEHNADAERPKLMRMLEAGKSVALISDAGTPLISDPGFKLVREAAAQAIAITAVPGASAVMAAVTLSGLPTDRFHFAGFLPSRHGPRQSRLAELATIPSSLVLFESPNRLHDTLAAMAAALGQDRPAAVARELTKRFEEIRRGTLAELVAWSAEAPARGEIAIIVGPPLARIATDADIEAVLSELLASAPLKEAARTVAERLGIPRSRVYDIGIAMKGRA
ncbi:MAG: 16S rRNA (cytidine(1402)-2'-O)-methyltransferase [Proteobacteria bacterium]|nr:16S rRNA (cytidine(1402)-2'-O)-methyltransferase [Pseudomonadota bacterium]